MLYLMMDKGAGYNLVKIGYSDGLRKLHQRRGAYFSYNPRAIMRSSCAGSRQQELESRAKLVEMEARRIPSTEWFEVSDEVFQLLYEKGMEVFRPTHQPIHFLECFIGNKPQNNLYKL